MAHVFIPKSEQEQISESTVQEQLIGEKSVQLSGQSTTIQRQKLIDSTQSIQSTTTPSQTSQLLKSRPKMVKKHVIVGKPGSGKSWYVGYLIEQEALIYGRHIVIIDPHYEHAGLVTWKKPQIRTIYLKEENIILDKKGKPVGIKLNWVEILQKFPYLLVTSFRMIPEHFEFIISKLFYAIIEVGYMYVVIDEVHRWARHDGIDPNLGTLAVEGRKFGVDLTVASVRTTKINSDLFDLANIRTFFRLDGEHDIDHIKSYMNSEELEEVRKLKPRQALEQNTLTNQTYLINTNDLKRLTKHYG